MKTATLVIALALALPVAAQVPLPSASPERLLAIPAQATAQGSMIDRHERQRGAQ
jgi:hypothetical protein